MKKFKKENRLWGAGRIHGELVKLQINVSETTVRNILKDLGYEGLDKSKGPTWREFMRQHKTIWAMDLFAVETAFLKTHYVFVIMDVQSRVLLDLKISSSSAHFWISNEKNDKVVGYGFERASRTAFEYDGLSANAKLACLLRIVRAKEGLTQEQAADRVGHLTMRHYQRLEFGEENTTLKMVEAIAKALPKWDFPVVLKKVP